MVHVAAGIRGQDNFLPHRGQTPQIPACTGKGALGVLSRRSGKGERVELQLDTSTGNGIGETATIIDFGQGNRDAALSNARAQGLHSPAGEREIAVTVDAFGRNRRAQPVIVRKVVAAQQRAVGHAADRPRNAPQRIDLEPPACVEVAAKLVRPDRRPRHKAAAVGCKAADAVRPVGCKRAIHAFNRRGRRRIESRGQCQVAIRSKFEIIGQNNLNTVGAVILDIGDQQTAAPVAAG